MKPYVLRLTATGVIMGLAIESAHIIAHDCEPAPDYAFCRQPSLEPPNLHTTHREPEPTFFQDTPWIVSGGVSSATANSTALSTGIYSSPWLR